MTLKNLKCLRTMDNFWTCNKPINGLRHFVLVNEIKEKDQIIFLLVSVLDVEVNLKITSEQLIKSGNWEKGWINLSKIESITKAYIEYKLSKKAIEETNKIYINDDSLFNIS